MKRDMDLVRLILLKIEEEYCSSALFNLSIDGYDMETVAYHCKILFDGGMVSAYKAQNADNELAFFCVGSLTWEGHDFLDKIRDNSRWHKVKDTIAQRGLPLIVDTIKAIATAFVTAATEGAVKAILNGGGTGAD